MRPIAQLGFLFLTVASLAGCQGFGPNARAGSALGGTTGTLAGAAIGSQNGNTLEGAILGGAIGALAGGTVGDSIDELEYRDRLNQQQIVSGRQQAAVSPNQLVQMTSSGLSEDLIISQIQSGGCTGRLTTNDLITLKQQGVSDRVLTAYQNCGASTPLARQVYPAPMVIPYDTFHYNVAPYHAYPVRPCPPRYRRHAGSFGIHVGF